MDLAKLIMSRNLRADVRRFNLEFLALGKELSRHCAAAAPLLGVEQAVVDVLRDIPSGKLQMLADSDMVLARLRFADPVLWQRLAQGELDGNHLLHEFLKTLPSGDL